MLDDLRNALLFGSMDWRESNVFCRNIKNHYSGKRRPDDVFISLFQGEGKNKIKQYKNKSLLSTALLYFVWFRIHRQAFYKEKFDLYVPDDKKIAKVVSIIDRVSHHVCKDDPMFLRSRFLVACLSGDYTLAERISRKMTSCQGSYLEDFFSGSNSFFFPMSLPVNQDSRCDLEYFDRAESLSGDVILVSCDVKYFEKFHERFLVSARKNGITNTVVFLILDEGESFRYDEHWNYYAIPTDIGYEKTPALFASARFLVAERIMEAFGSGVYIFDIDFDFGSVGSDLFKDQGCYDLCLSFNKYGRAFTPWCAVSAAACYFSHSPSSKFFLSVFSSYFNFVYKVGGRWWIDQNALFYSLKKLQAYYPTARVGNFISIRDLGVTNGDASVSRFKSLARG